MKKAVKNIVSSILPQLINIITNFILPGLIIVKFGSEINGLISTTKTVVSYISLVGAGIATAVTQALYLPVANRDENTIKGMLKSANSMFNRYGLIYIGITVVVSLVYPYIIDTNISYGTIAGLLIVMSISGASEFFAIGRCRALLYAHQRVYVCSVIQAISLAISLVLALIMLKLDASILLIQFMISFVYVLRGVFLTGYIKKKYPQYSDYKSAKPIDSVIEKRNDAMIHQLSGLAVTGSQTAILTVIVGLKAASIYSVYNIVLSGLKMICANLCTAITPFLGKKYALGEKEELRKMYNAIELIFFVAIAFILAVTLIMIVPFVALYTKDADINYVYPLFSGIFVISTAFYIIKLPSTALINVAGHFKETRWRAIIEGALSVILSIIFTLIVGKEGVLLGTGCALAWRCIDTIIYTSKYILECSSVKSFIRIFVILINIFIFKLLFNLININITDFYQWVMLAIIISVVVIVLLLLEMLIFERKTVKYIVEYFKRRRK